ncbi:MAG: hypothetical protein ACRDD8_06005 [Bacteroidales bacterium]
MSHNEEIILEAYDTSGVNIDIGTPNGRSPNYIDIKDFEAKPDISSEDELLLSDASKFGKAAKTKLSDIKRNFQGSVGVNDDGFVTGGDVHAIGESKLDNPSNAGKPGYILVRTDTGSQWESNDAASNQYEPGVPDDMIIPNKVGGVQAGITAASLRGKRFSEIIDDLLFETVNPTLHQPTSLLSIIPSEKLLEIGLNTRIEVTASFNQGSIVLNNVKQNPLSGVATRYVFGGSIVADGVGNIVEKTMQIPNDTLTFTCSVHHNAGPQPLNNKGQIYGSPLPAGVVKSQVLQIEGTYPLFAATTVPGDRTKLPLVSMSSVSYVDFRLVSEQSGTKQVFWLPWCIKTLKSIQILNTLSGNYEDVAIASFTKSTVMININGVDVEYNKYIHNGPDRGVVDIKLKF